MMVCHTCDNRKCVNPSHLWLGNAKSNGIDASKKGRTMTGEKNGNSKLKKEDVIKIRELYNKKEMSGRELGKLFDVDKKTISNIVKKIQWARV